MYIELEPQSRLQPYVSFDWRLVAERGLLCYGHFHQPSRESKSVATCEIGFLKKTSTSDESAARNNGAASGEQEALAAAGPAIPVSAVTLTRNSQLLHHHHQQQQQHQQGSSATRRAAQFKCVGAIRKAGFLSVKKWILKRRSSIELARKQGWKRYWVSLRGTALLFHSVLDTKHKATLVEGRDEQDENSCINRIDLLSWIKANCAVGDCATSSSAQLASLAQAADLLLSAQAACGGGDTNLSAGSESMSAAAAVAASQCFIEREPRHLIIIDGAIAQPIPEHPKRDFVFCLSTTFGDAYLFQASCQLESDNWIAAIHNACAASIARDLTRDEAAKLFETKVRRLELEAEKKLFLRQRLESRLTSMSSMSHIGLVNEAAALESANCNEQQQQQPDAQAKKTTMRSLLHKLQQQLLALDTYIEQVHCEVYQLRCYLCSCATQQLFYHSRIGQEQRQQSQLGVSTATTRSTSAGALLAIDLPHPKSLLMHVSKPTKLLLIKLGVFTVSSFHAYIHARSGSADSILQKIQLQQQLAAQQSPQTASPALELRVRSRSISESLLSKTATQNAELEQDTEQLIDMTNLRLVCISLSRKLFFAIRRGRSKSSHKCKSKSSGTASTADQDDFELEQRGEGEEQLENNLSCQQALQSMPAGGDISDDRFSIKESGDQVLINLKLHSNSLPMSIIKQVLTIIDPNSGELDFLNYYLRFNVMPNQAQQAASSAASSPTAIARQSPKEQKQKQEDEQYYVTKRRETLNDWLKLEPQQQLELLEKLVFEVELQRSRLDEEEEAFPFGIAIGAQLFASNFDSQLNVYCSYIEWGSVADKASLTDDDEFLVINGVPVMDLDMMFVECILQDATKLKLVVRSSRTECPPNAIPLDRYAWKQSGGGGDDDSFAKDTSGGARGRRGPQQPPPPPPPSSSQIISDEYISSLVCPPPPAQSNAFLRTNATATASSNNCGDGGVFLLRHKSDLSAERNSCRTEPLVDDDDDDDEQDHGGDENRTHHHQLATRISKAKSQQNIDSTFLVDEVGSTSLALANGECNDGDSDDEKLKKQSASNRGKSFLAKQLNPVELATQLLRKTEQLTQLLAGRNPVVDECLAQPTADTSKHHYHKQANNNKHHHPFQEPSGVERDVELAAIKLVATKAKTTQALSSAEQVLALIGRGVPPAPTEAARQPRPVSMSSSATLSSSSASLTAASTGLMGVGGGAGPTAGSQQDRDHSIERLRKSVLELLETEYAYIRHLETICEHYMSPLEGLAYLNIPDLKHLRQVIAELVSFQRDFFDKLIKSIAEAATSGPAAALACAASCSASGSKEQLTITTAEASKLSQQDEFEELNKIVRQFDLFKSIEQFKPSLRTLSKVFQSESEHFKLYASYCAAYARFQKLLHPKRHQSSNGAGSLGGGGGGGGSAGASGGSATSLVSSANVSTTIVSLPNALDTFTSSNTLMPILGVGGGHVQTHRVLMRPLSSFMASGFGGGQTAASTEVAQFSAQLKQLGEFLGSLDSSSSSASLSLAKSSSSASGSASELCQQQAADSKHTKHPAAAAAKQQQQQASGSFQKSVHQQNFESYLIKPIQRIVKYPMLLNSIAISAARVFSLNASQQQLDYNNNQEQLAGYSDDGLLGELQAAVKHMESVTSHVNDAQRVYDDYGMLFDHIERQYLDQQAELACLTSKSPAAATATAAAIPLLGSPHQPPIGLGIEQLLYFGPVDWLNVHEFTSSSKQLKKGIHCLSQLLFVFTSCVVFICKERIRPTTSQQQQQPKRRGLTMGSASFAGGNFSSSSNLFANQTNTSVSAASSAGGGGNQNFQQQAPGSSLAASSTKAAANLHNQQKLGSQQEHCQEVIRYQTLIPVSEVQVRSAPAGATASRSASESSDCFRWELFRCSSVNSNSNLLAKSSGAGKQTPATSSKFSGTIKGVGKVYLLSCSTNEARSTFLRKIRFTIRESVRNMSLPLARSPSSKSLTPKKFSSPSSGTNTNSSCSHSTSLSPVCCQKDHSNNKDSSIHLNRKNQHKHADCQQRRADDCEFASSNQVVPVDGPQFKTSIQVNN